MHDRDHQYDFQYIHIVQKFPFAGLIAWHMWKPNDSDSPFRTKVLPSQIYQHMFYETKFSSVDLCYSL